MSKTTNVKKSVIVDFSIYHNEETGEALSSELSGNGLMVSIKEETDLVTMKTPDNFAFINTDVLSKVIPLLSDGDLAHLLKMIPLTKTEMNMLFNNTIPHTNATLQKYLKIVNRTAFHKVIKRLISSGILYQIKGNIYGKVRVVYILNPHLSNRRKTFHKSLFDIFKDFK